MSNSLPETIRTRVRALCSTTRVGLYVGVGTFGAAVDTATLVFLVEITDLGTIVSKLLAWELGIAVIFVINEQWTFASYGEGGLRALWHRFMLSNVVRFGGLLVTLVVLSVLTGHFGVGLMLANVIGIGAGFFVNYICECLYTWQVYQDQR
ncbi:GtrA family protein [Natrinema salsiterrestre]|uniref:GtrA family protein n=1 Tax=Natrinema salsiterrestre TaxID=2950540 RepID=A0A9Q4KZZ6_9EURY|nr:GtrA family protein [Natrinema salsiterrestre]MDF9745431.1 GtrA family protein [Natrinema salsiterrestre]